MYIQIGSKKGGLNINKIIKDIIIAIVVIIIFLVIFITVDCIRLKNSKTGTKPIITINEKEKSARTTYYGLGYSVQYYDITGTMGYGANFRLFSIFALWSWEAQ